MISIYVNCQTSHSKDVILMESDKFSTDTTTIKLYRLDTIAFAHLISQKKEFIVQFWEPWCGGVTYWIEQLNKLQKLSMDLGIDFILISDSRFEQQYFINQSKSVGKIVYYFNKYGVEFKSYIMSQGTEFQDYFKVLEHYIPKGVNEDNLVFYIKNSKVIYSNSTYHFYKHFFRKYRK